MVKRVYTIELLNDLLKESGATLKGEVQNTTKRSLITYYCHCGEERTKTFEAIKKDLAYCKQHQYEILLQKRLATFKEKYGENVTHMNQIPGVTEKKNKKMMEKYGTTVYFKTDEYRKSKIKYNYIYLIKLLIKSNSKFVDIADKDKTLTRESNINFVCKCGNEGTLNFRNIEKIGAVCFEERNKISVEKTKNTMIKKYGVENAQHDPVLFEKGKNSAYVSKEYKFPSGKIIKIQGYEHFALRDLLEIYDEDDIKIGSDDRKSKVLPTISYKFDDKNKKYYPDIFIKSENKIIEVKSDFTYKSKKEQNIAKKDACIDLGYDFEFYIYDRNGKRLTF